MVILLKQRVYSMWRVFFCFKQKTAYDMRISDWSSDVCSSDLVADQFQIPVLSVGAGGSNSEYVYSLGLPYDDGYAKSMADFLIDARDKKGAKLEAVALVYTDYETGQEVSKGMEKRLKAAGLKIVADVPLPAESENYKPQLARINSLHHDVDVGRGPHPNMGMAAGRE